MGEGDTFYYTPIPKREVKLSKWDLFYLKMCNLVATMSKDPSTKCGAVVVDEWNRVISLGYNGLPRGLEDKDEYLNVRETKYKLILHAEQNAILFSAHHLTDCKIYTTPFMPCTSCMALIIQSKIGMVICPSPPKDKERWKENFELSRKIAKEAGVLLIET